MNLTEIYLNRYLPSNLRIRSESTKRHYRVTLKDLNRFLGRSAQLSDLNDDTIQAFARWLVESQKIAPQTINQRLNYLAALWRWCAKRRMVEYWPTFSRLDEPKIVPRAWTQEQLNLLMPVLQAQEGQVGGVPASLWWVNLHCFLWQTGERIGATLKMTWKMLDRSAGTVDVPARIRKGQYRGMLYTISGELMESLFRQKRSWNEQVFAWPHSEQTLYNRYSRILRRAGLPDDHRSKFHRMRRSFASHLTAGGGNATLQMKHASARVTLDSYLDPTISDGTPNHQRLPRLGDAWHDQAG